MSQPMNDTVNQTESTIEKVNSAEYEDLLKAYQALAVKYSKLFDLYVELFDKYLGNNRKTN